MHKKSKLKRLWKVLKNSFAGVGEDKITKLSASLAYYTVFSLGPLLIVIVFLASVFYKKEAVEGNLYEQIEGFIGHDAAVQLQTIIENAAVSNSGTLAAIIGVVTLVIGATTVFADMQDSINHIWNLKPKPKAGIVKLLMDRLLSFGVIVSLGFLLLVSLIVSAVIDALNAKLTALLPGISVTLIYVGNLILSFAIITILFMIIFKVLPDAKVKWRDVLSGAVATAFLFMLGKLGISFYIRQSDVASTYGTAGSLVIILLWIYYSSIILYFGAEFTKAYAVEFGGKILPNEYSVVAQRVEIERNGESLQAVEQDKEIEREKKKAKKE